MNVDSYTNYHKQYYSIPFGLNDEDNIMNLKQYGFCIKISVVGVCRYSIELLCLTEPKNVDHCICGIKLSFGNEYRSFSRWLTERSKTLIENSKMDY